MGKRKNRKIEKLIEQLKKFKRANRIERMILFGSAARGEMRKDSDVDMIIVDKKFSKLTTFERGRGLWVKWHTKHKIDHPVDFLFFSPEEFNKLKKEVSIVSEALREGIEI